PLRLLALESRLAPAVAAWDGGGADDRWTTAANWAGDVAPAPGDDLVFPSGAARLANVNDFPAVTTFGHISLNGYNYQITGNTIALTNGIGSILPGGPPGTPPSLGVDINFNT